jgi:hypothetical protein
VLSGAGALDPATTRLSKTSRTKNLIIEVKVRYALSASVEGDPIFELLRMWAAQNPGREVTNTDLSAELAELAEKRKVEFKRVSHHHRASSGGSQDPVHLHAQARGIQAIRLPGFHPFHRFHPGIHSKKMFVIQYLMLRK